MFEFHVSRLSREKYDFDKSIYRFDGNVIFADFLAARQFAQKINQKRDLVLYPEAAVSAGDINAIGLIDEIFHYVFSLYRKNIDPDIIRDAYSLLTETYGEEKIETVLLQFVEEFPPMPVLQGTISPERYLQSDSKGTPNQEITLEELIMLWITNRNPAVESFSELFDDERLRKGTDYHKMITTLKTYFADKPHFGPDDQDLYTMLRSPAIKEPYSLVKQLEFIRRKWGTLLGEFLYRLLSSIDLIREETKAVFAGPGPAEPPSYLFFGEEDENFSPDSDWMPHTVLMAKNTYVWLYQLSEIYDREIKRLDQIPDKELDKLAGWGFNALWLIGLWQRSEASKRIKQLCGNPEAVASAYSLKNYSIANDLGGETAYQRLREKAASRGIRLASDMVPNHMGIDSDWVLNHPDWFISLPHSPFPSYTFNGPDLSPTDRVSIVIEDHYFNRTDAAVVFKRYGHETGDTKYIYHGNDGTSMPWNDTAQLDYLNEDVREAVIQTILHVARKFPIIRFDAAMTLAKKHYQRLWFPQPGSGGDIASRAEYGLMKEDFENAFPTEFWREVVDRVAEEVPNTLLLAEAFWMMEGYFVRTLGMHRVYNSAFMNMLRNEDNSKYRLVIKNTLEFDPQILKRYVNFMNNPDEKTAIEQFGKGDKYFGICTMMVTMPGLPMFGHGQIEGFSEKYGMEYFRPYWDEDPDQYLIQRHQQTIFPLLKRRDLFSGVENFLLYDFYAGNGVNEDVFAFSNGNLGERALVIFHNCFGTTSGWIKVSSSYLNKQSGELENKTLIDGLGLSSRDDHFVIFEDGATGLEYIHSIQEIEQKGMHFNLNAYDCHVFTDFREVSDHENGQYTQLNSYLNGRGVPSIDDALQELLLAPILYPLRELINPTRLHSIYKARIDQTVTEIDTAIFSDYVACYDKLITSIKDFVSVKTDQLTIISEEQRGLEAVLKLADFIDQYPFPRSKKYKTILTYIQKNLTEDPFIWYILILWNDLRLIGRVVTSEDEFIQISRSWIEEWGILRLVQETMGSLGVSQQQIQRGITILKLLISQQLWVDNIEEQSPLSLIESWLNQEAIRDFLNVNRYRGILWFNKEAFETMMWWMLTTSLIRLVADPKKGLAEVIEKLFEANSLIGALLEAEKDSDYQVEKLLEALK